MGGRERRKKRKGEIEGEREEGMKEKKERPTFADSTAVSNTLLPTAPSLRMLQLVGAFPWV